jgi:hypothetical protein
MGEDEPDAVYYFRKAAEGLQDEMTGASVLPCEGVVAVGREFGCADGQGEPGWDYWGTACLSNPS